MNQFSKWNSETQYKICKVVEEQDKLKLEQKSQELELCLKMTDAEIFQKKNQHIL